MDYSANFNHLLNSQVQYFIRQHENDDEVALVLKHKEILSIQSAEIAQQIVGRRKAKDKLPLYYDTPGIIYPPKINIEQCSSERAASFKASLHRGVAAVDLTGGLGVDSYFFSKRFEKVFYVEPNESLLQIAHHNHKVLGANIEHQCLRAESFLNSNTDHFDLIYLDPSRRNSANRKVFKFADCSPNIVELLPSLLERSNFILVKASPLIDIQQGIRELGMVSKVFVVGFNNECKEILFQVSSKKTEPEIVAVDLSTNKIDTSFSFMQWEEGKAQVSYAEPMQLLYEPSAMILKAGAFKLIAQKYSLKKLAPNTHLYTSSELIASFPGRVFSVDCLLKSDPKSIHEVLPKGYANLLTRNYPLSPSQLKKKLKLQDGGEQYVIGFSGTQKKFLLLAARIK